MEGYLALIKEQREENDKLQQEIERLQSIIKEVREYIDYFLKEGHTKNWKQFEYSLLEILDKGE